MDESVPGCQAFDSFFFSGSSHVAQYMWKDIVEVVI